MLEDHPINNNATVLFGLTITVSFSMVIYRNMPMPKRLFIWKRPAKLLPPDTTFALCMFILITEFSHPQNLQNILMSAVSITPSVELAHIGKMELLSITLALSLIVHTPWSSMPWLLGPKSSLLRCGPLHLNMPFGSTISSHSLPTTINAHMSCSLVKNCCTHYYPILKFLDVQHTSLKRT